MENILINPILPGFNPDPSICRRGDDYYLAVSSFEWYPGVPVYHSRDLKNWRLLTYCIRDEKILDLRGLHASRGIWAPCLSYCEADGLFYLAFTIMRSVNAGFFDLDNYVTTAPDIEGPWDTPAYIHSAGFDPSLFHDGDGKKYMVSLEWETREDYYKPGEICIVEYEAKSRKPVGEAVRIYRGGTTRGWIEGPHLYKRNGWYYLICAEGGTSYNHCVSVARSRNVFGPYEAYEHNPIITSKADIFPNTYESWNNNIDTIPAPGVDLQRAGHASLIETRLGELYAFHLCGRPFLPEVRCTLGRETAIQRMEWTGDDWPRMAGGGNIAQVRVKGSDLPSVMWDPVPVRDDFDSQTLGVRYICPRIDYRSYIDLSARRGYLRIRGQESLSSTYRVSLIARKLTSLHACLKTKMEFTSHRYSQYAGICVYYDESNYLTLRKIYDEASGKQVLDLLKVECGEKHEPLEASVPLEASGICLKLEINGRDTVFYWSYDDSDYRQIGGVFDTSKYSDEYGNCGDNTGAVVGIFCVDAYRRENCADFDWFEYKDN